MENIEAHNPEPIVQKPGKGFRNHRRIQAYQQRWREANPDRDGIPLPKRGEERREKDRQRVEIIDEVQGKFRILNIGC